MSSSSIDLTSIASAATPPNEARLSPMLGERPSIEDIEDDMPSRLTTKSSVLKVPLCESTNESRFFLSVSSSSSLSSPALIEGGIIQSERP
jgi:hypothetical protein